MMTCLATAIPRNSDKLPAVDGVYRTAPRPISLLARIFPSIVFYWRMCRIVFSAAWKARRGITLGQTRADLVPLSSGGVFAEAVPGRSNSAETLDMTRFRNCQDSGTAKNCHH